jgi:hypothetical protein
MLTTHSHTPARVIAATLAIGAIAVPAASARPSDLNSPVGASVARGHAAADLRSADAREAARLSERAQDLRRLEAGNGATANLSDSASRTPQTPPAVSRAWSQRLYYTSYGHPQTIHRVVSVDDGTPWLTIGGSIAGVVLLIGGSAALAGRRPRRPAPAPRVAV